jgi:hypothetical protein
LAEEMLTEVGPHADVMLLTRVALAIRRRWPISTIGTAGCSTAIHADGDTDHSELWTEEGAQVLLVVPPEDYMLD